MIAIPISNEGVPILDAIPRNARGAAYIDIDVYLRDTRTGRTVVHRSEYGNVDRGPLLVGPDWREEEHDFFYAYWWNEGNMGCDCNRQGLWGDDGPLCGDGVDELPHNEGANVIVIDKITPAGMPGVVLYSDADRDR